MRSVLVTGAAGGIGHAMVRTFRANDWRVIAVDRRAPDAAEPDVHWVRTDIATPEGIQNLVAELADVEELDALINNAAIDTPGPLTQADSADVDLVFATNLRAPMRVMAETRDRLRRRGGAVVNVASVHALATSVNVTAYAASKGGLVALTRAVAVEWATDGIRCNAVLPGAVDTPMLDQGLGRREHPQGAAGNLRDLQARTPLGRIGRPAEVAEAALFLADADRSSFVTGQSLVVDGGVLARLSSE